MRTDLPAGTVTLLFTDVEGSSRLLSEIGASAYADALAGHRRIVRAACVAHGGVEVDTQGDAFLFSFADPHGAVDAAAEFTDGLAAGPVRVRVGIHTGTPLLTDEGYVGEDVHLAARIAAAGHGGQVLVSTATATLVGAEAFRDLGEHRLKDLSAARRIHQLGFADHPALATLHRTNLPVPLTPFLGREAELQAIVALLGRADVRLVTLTGPGGTGKSRLAMQSAAVVGDRYPGGVWWVPLAPLRDPALVMQTASQILGTQSDLGEYNRDQRLLLVLDNFEHVVGAAQDVAGLLAACPGLHVLVTSREPLHISGEQEFAVPSLSEVEAIALFTARARAVDPSFAPDASVAEICRRLDHLPLALELAAVRVKALATTAILQRLEQRFALLTGGTRDAPERQRTLRATLDWSYDLLEPAEQELFAGLATFRGGCTLEAAEAICDAALDPMHTLVDKSLLQHAGDRYSMLETVHAYAGELLERSARRDDLHRRHLAHYLVVVMEAEPLLTGRDQRRWFEHLAREEDNVREALAYACRSGDGERALLLAGSFWRFWWTRGQVDEAAGWYERAFAVGGEASDLARARALFGSAHMSEARGDVRRTRQEFTAAADLLRRVGDTRWLILALTHLGGSYSETDRDRAERIQREALELAEASGDIRGAAIVKGNLVYQMIVTGHPDEAAILEAQALAAHRELGDVFAMARADTTLASLAARSGDLEAARDHLREALELSRSIGDALGLSTELGTAAAVAIRLGQADRAARLGAAAEVHLRIRGIALETPDAGDLRTAMEAARLSLAGDFTAACDAGAALDLEQAVDLAILALAAAGDPDHTPIA